MMMMLIDFFIASTLSQQLFHTLSAVPLTPLTPLVYRGLRLVLELLRKY